MRTTNAYRNDDTRDAADADGIHPEALKAARERRGLTQAQLAQALGCGKETVSRWERGRSRRLHPRHRESLCAALGVEWAALAEPGSGAPDGISGDDNHAAFRLAAERYGIGVRDVMEAAPLLFVIAAERSLMERRRRLMPHFKAGRIAIGDYLGARRERDEAGLRQRVSEALARAEREARNASPAPAGMEGVRK